MKLRLLLFMASVVLVCSDCIFKIKDLSNSYGHDTSGDNTTEYMYIMINCGEDLIPYSTKVHSKFIYMFVCTNSSYEGYDPSYYKDILLDYYNISSNALGVEILYGSRKNSVFHNVKRIAIFGPSFLWNTCIEETEMNIEEYFERAVLRPSLLYMFSKYTSLSTLDIRDTNLNDQRIVSMLSEIYLEQLTLRNCSLSHLPDNFIDLTPNLVKLDLSHNHLRFISFEPPLRKWNIFKNLELLDLSYNKLFHGSFKWYTAALMPRLQYLILDHNSDLNICNIDLFNEQATKVKDQHLIEFLDLRNISASFTNTSKLCFGHMKAENLTVFNISYSKISTLSLQELPAITAPFFTMNLQENNTTDVTLFGSYEYKAMISRYGEHNNTKVTVLVNMNQLQCDCQYSWLHKALKDFSNLNLKNIYCSDGTQLIHHEWDQLNCTKFRCGDCVCRRYVKSTTAHCSPGLTRTFPMVEDLSHLYAASNQIESLNASLFSDTLVWVDISDNKMSLVDLEIITAMFSKKDRRFKLAGNSITCDCTNKVLLETLRFHRLQVDDYNELTCAVSGIFLKGVKEDQLCDSQQSISETLTSPIALSAFSVVVVVFALMTFIYYRYRHHIKIFLYARGWLHRFIGENDIDENRPYDVFISFAHEDVEFVTHELLPGLEMGATEYKTCVHLRDWIPGEMIPTQIIKSIERSRRTLLVVSKSYLKSLWGLMEFHTAHASSMNERRIRVIVILLEDIMCDDDILDPKLRLYMQTNTYLRWGDPWFWDKLRYALPHKPEN